VTSVAARAVIEVIEEENLLENTTWSAAISGKSSKN
jgi:4-aminobutyrate aminotransferase-like enzyme